LRELQKIHRDTEKFSIPLLNKILRKAYIYLPARLNMFFGHQENSNYRAEVFLKSVDISFVFGYNNIVY